MAEDDVSSWFAPPEPPTAEIPVIGRAGTGGGWGGGPVGPGTGAVIEMDDVTKVYRTGSLAVAALRGVSFTIEAGEYVSIMGPSGSGKSTLMHILGCLDVPTGGRYWLGGRGRQPTWTRSTWPRSATATSASCSSVQPAGLPAGVAQRRAPPHLRRRRTARNARQRAVDALERVGLADRVDHRPGELSGGQQQRVAIARALVGEPSMILADEPTGALDSKSAHDVLALLAELHQAGRTLIVITHDPDVADGRPADASASATDCSPRPPRRRHELVRNPPHRAARPSAATACAPA